MPGLLMALAPILDRVFGSIFPDPAQKAKAVADALAQFAALDLGQIKVNEAEAGNASLFVAGWRPMIGWVCAAALAYQYLLVPLLAWAWLMAGTPLPPMPKLDGALWELMAGMLGLGALRSLEKIKGAA